MEYILRMNELGTLLRIRYMLSLASSAIRYSAEVERLRKLLGKN